MADYPDTAQNVFERALEHAKAKLPPDLNEALQVLLDEGEIHDGARVLGALRESIRAQEDQPVD